MVFSFFLTACTFGSHGPKNSFFFHRSLTGHPPLPDLLTPQPVESDETIETEVRTPGVPKNEFVVDIDCTMLLELFSEFPWLV